MNRKIKAISAALLAAAMCVSFAGCADNEKPENGDSKTEPDTTESVNQSSAESSAESTADSSSKGEKSDDKQSEMTLAPTDEIKNAGFDAGLVQWYNDVFQCGGYVSVPEFIEKYKSSYEIMYNGEPISEEALSNSVVEPGIDENGNVGHVSLQGVPKFTVKGSQNIENLTVKVMNPKDQSAPLSECYVDYVSVNRYSYGFRARGFIADNGVLSDFVDVSAPEYLKSLGYEEITRPGGTDGYELKASMEYDKKFFKDLNDTYYFYDVGGPNAFGARPFYRNKIGFTGRVTVPINIAYIFE